MNTVNLLTIPASVVPEQDLVVFGNYRQTYQETCLRVQRLAAALAALGIAAGDAVAVLDTNSPRYLEAYFATSMLGGVFVPLNYRARGDELAYMIRTADVRLLMVGDRYTELVDGLRDCLHGVSQCVAMESVRPTMLHFDALIARSTGEVNAADVDLSDRNVLIYTSGTTGRPKGVMLSHGDFVTYVCAHAELADGTRRGATLLCVPLYHIAGLTSMLTSVFTGRRLVILPQFEAAEWLETVQREHITHAFLVPTMLQRVLDHPRFCQDACASLEILAYGAAPMPVPVIRRAIATLPSTVGFINAFGQTETTATVTALLPDDHRLQGTAEEITKKIQRLGSIGRAVSDVEVRIVDAEGAEVASGEVGEIVVRTTRLMTGYVSQDEASPPTIENGWLHTRDLGWIDAEGYIFLAGRKDDLIIRGGENISPAEVEAVLQAHPAIEEAAVIGLPDGHWGEQVMAIVVPTAESALTAEEVIVWCHQRLASFKKPTCVQFVRALPRNALGKVLRHELRQQYTRPC